MPSRKSKIIIIVGPTASGKSELAVRLAKKFGGEIISGDSRQVYRGLDIGTGKVPGKWTLHKKNARSHNFFTYRGIRHHCIDFISPKQRFTAAEFKTCAKQAIQDITSRDKIPIIAGGTAFWIDALAYDLDFPPVPPNPKLRRHLARKSPQELLRILQKLDPERAQAIEPKNPRRLIRAIEIARTLGRVPPIKKTPTRGILWLGIAPSKTWSGKVRRRIKNMLRTGFIPETQRLLRHGVGKKRIKEFGFEYYAALYFLEGKISRRELCLLLLNGTKKYAKKQMGWWKRNKKIRWVSESRSAEKLAKNFLHFDGNLGSKLPRLRVEVP